MKTIKEVIETGQDTIQEIKANWEGDKLTLLCKILYVSSFIGMIILGGISMFYFIILILGTILMILHFIGVGLMTGATILLELPMTAKVLLWIILGFGVVNSVELGEEGE